MLLTKQQKYLLATLEKLGCAELRQLAALLQKMFAFSSLDDAVRVTSACIRQMQMGVCCKSQMVLSVYAQSRQFRSG